MQKYFHQVLEVQLRSLRRLTRDGPREIWARKFKAREPRVNTVFYGWALWHKLA